MKLISAQTLWRIPNIIQELLCHPSQCGSVCICLPQISMNIFILDSESRCLWGEKRFSSEQRWGGLSQLTYCLSAVKQVLCSPCSVCCGSDEHWQPWPCVPRLSQLQLPSAMKPHHPKVLAIHGLEPQRLPQRL